MSKRALERKSSTTDTSNFKAKISLETPLADYIRLIRSHVQCDDYIEDEELENNFKEIASVARDVIWQLLFNSTTSTKRNENTQVEEPDDNKDVDRKDDDDNKDQVGRTKLTATTSKTGSTDTAETAAASSTTLTQFAEEYKKAAELLEEHKCDAGFYAPFEYNDWILNVRDELLKRKMIDFWRDVIVKKELGPCWARDSDLFDDLEDPKPAEFYAHAGCTAPFLNEVFANQVDVERENDVNTSSTIQLTTSTATVTDVATTVAAGLASSHSTVAACEFNPVITKENAVSDYQELMQEHVRSEEFTPDEVLKTNFQKIAAVARDVLWSLLFPEDSQEKLNESDYNQAAELLEDIKSDACYYDPWTYNSWIVTVRDELLRREMFDFWREIVVKLELGLCWAKDSDFFDDLDDPEPETFYAHAGCKAVFSHDDSEDKTEDVKIASKTDEVEKS